MKKHQTQNKSAKLKAAKAEISLEPQEIDLNHAVNIKTSMDLSNPEFFNNGISNLSAINLAIGKNLSATLGSIRMTGAYVENVLNGHFFDRDANRIIGSMDITNTIYHPNNHEASHIHGTSYLTNGLDNFLTVNKAGQTLYDISLFAKDLFKPTTLCGQLNTYQDSIFHGNVITYNGIKGAALAPRLCGMVQTHLADLYQHIEKFNPIVNGIAKRLSPISDVFDKIGQYSAAINGAGEVFSHYNNVPLSYSISAIKREDSSFIHHPSKWMSGCLNNTFLSAGIYQSIADNNSLKITASILTDASNHLITGKYPSSTDLGLGTIASSNLGMSKYISQSGHLLPSLHDISGIQGLYSRSNDFTTSYNAINNMLKSTKSFRWHPEVDGGVWKNEPLKPQKQINEEVLKLQNEVLELKHEVNFLKYTLEQFKKAQTHLLDNKIATVEKKLQFALTSSAHQNTTAVQENTAEELIDRYAVMKMLGISERTYYRNKKTWTTYQIGSKRLYKASEIKAHIKCFLK